MKKLLVVLLMVTVLCGCFGKFQLTRNLYSWNKDVGNKWAQEVVFLLLAVLPVYEVVGIMDIVFFNTLEFWTGENPLESRVIEQGDKKLVMNYNQRRDLIEVKIFSCGKLMETIVLARSEKGVELLNSEGELLYSSCLDKEGGIRVSDARGRHVNYYDAQQVAKGFPAPAVCQAR